MATSSEETINTRDESSGGNCHDETELRNSDIATGRKHFGRKKRILYDREFLIKCFHSAASARKPSGFPIAHLDCTLGASKVKRLPLAAPQAYLPPKRKEDNAKRDREEDNISLRPHSGNFSGGCGPNLTSPSHVPLSSGYSRIHSQEEPKGYDSRDYHRNNFRYGGHQRDRNDRGGRMDRDREQDRDPRDRMNRDRMSGSNHRGSNSWSNDGQDNSDWSRRRNGAHFPRDRDYNNKRYSNDRGRDYDEQEPEWFSGGPSSQHETIELRGFMDDDRREKTEELHNGYEGAEHNGEIDSGNESGKYDQPSESESPMDLSIEKILKMDHIPGILTNDLLETEEPSGSSRFSQLFKRNSATPDPGLGRAAQYAQQDNSPSNTEDKSKAVHEMGELLRSMLFKKSPAPEPSPEAKPKDAAKPASATKDDVDAFKKLVTPLFEKVLQGPGAPKSLNDKPTNPEQGQQQPNMGGNVMDIFKQPPQQPKAQNPSPPVDASRNNPLQDIFNNMLNKQAVPPPPGDIVPRLTPNQILQMIPPELQPLVLNMNVSQSDCVVLMNVAKSNEWTFRSVLHQFLLQQCPPQQHMMYTGILKLLISGAILLPGVIVQPAPSNNVVPLPPMSQHMPNHRAPNPGYEKVMLRPGEEGPKDLTKRSATPVSSMAFTPTSVMRKMTAEGTKSGPPPNPGPGFVPVVTVSGGLLPTPPTTAPVMMNSNNPNLASLMSNMARAPPPPPQMQFRPHPPIPMGYPPNPGFHPGMMAPPPMHGPVMLPPPFQNIIHNKPVFNNGDEN